MKVGDRIDVFKVHNSPYADKELYPKKDGWYAEVPGIYSGNKHGRNVLCNTDYMTHLNTPKHIVKVGTLIIKTIK